MAEDDEIDILGDFNIDNYLTKSDSSIYDNSSELLNCDYTIHPQWLLDKPNANPDCWYDGSLPATEQENPDSVGQISTENSITDESGWTEKEKNLLERGIEIFGKSNIRLSQFIGSKTPSEVKYYLKNFYSDTQPTYPGFSGVVDEMTNDLTDILDDTQIPASIEEVIAVVSTSKSSIQQINKRTKKKSISSSNNDIVSNAQMHSKGKDDFKSNKKKMAKFKFKTKLKIPLNNKLTNLKQKTVKVINHDNKRTELNRVEITTGKGLSVPICEGEEIVKISKDDTDSDIEIDVENSNEEKNTVEHFTIKQEIENPNTKIENQSIFPKINNNNNENNDKNKINLFPDLSTLNENIVKQLTSLDEPKEELKINENEITDLEKVVHIEFFEGRPKKTPTRYLKIRNHIINCWINQKPNYVKKTSVRQGLKNCGDVNCLSRIHCYLEQIGAINFGCNQTIYSRPLYDVFQSMACASKEKITKELKPQLKQIDLSSRNRTKRRFTKDGEGGCTLTHDENGHVIHTTVVNEKSQVAKPKLIKKPSIRLIYCRPLSETNKHYYKVKMHLTSLLLMDLHAHSSLNEVMGLVAGHWNPSNRTLSISHYEPCLNVASSLTHCDMCPISQAKAAESIHNQNLTILGWFHSHPTFAPEPSQQDLDTQQDVQLWIGIHSPCLGVILSPFCSNGALIGSPYRCMMVGKKENFEDQFVPYKFDVHLDSDCFELDTFMLNMKRICEQNSINNKQSHVDWLKPYFLDHSITYLEKFITSVRMHLAKCSNLNKMACDIIIDNIRCSLK